MKPTLLFSLPSFLCGVLLSSLTYPFLISGCECSYGHFMLYFNLLSRRHLSSLPRPAWAASSKFWLSDVLREYRTNLRAAEKKWCKSKDPSDLSKYQSLLSSLSAEVRTAKSSYFHNKINSAPDTHNLFKTFYSLQLDFTIQHLIISSVTLHHLPPLL